MHDEILNAIDSLLGPDEAEVVVIKRSDWERMRDALEASGVDVSGPAFAFDLLPVVLDRPVMGWPPCWAGAPHTGRLSAGVALALAEAYSKLGIGPQT